jgi:hypothetical protein
MPVPNRGLRDAYPDFTVPLSCGLATMELLTSLTGKKVKTGFFSSKTFGYRFRPEDKKDPGGWLPQESLVAYTQRCILAATQGRLLVSLPPDCILFHTKESGKILTVYIFNRQEMTNACLNPKLPDPGGYMPYDFSQYPNYSEAAAVKEARASWFLNSVRLEQQAHIDRWLQRHNNSEALATVGGAASRNLLR